jgi:excisionase family DNA binding protein
MENLINATEAATRINVSDQTMINWINQGRVPGAQKVGRTWIIPESSLKLIDKPVMGRPPKEEDKKKPLSE